MSKPKFLQALQEHYNLIGIASAFTLSMVVGNPLPLIIGLVAEAGYLIFVPDSKWYVARLSKKYDAEIEKQRTQLKERVFGSLLPEQQERFLRLEARRKQIESVAAEDKSWFREILRKLDYLLDKFLMFGAKEREFRTHLESLQEEVRKEPEAQSPFASSSSRRIRRDQNTTRPRQSSEQIVQEVQESYEREMSRIRSETDRELDDNTHSIQEKRLDVIQRRSDFVGKIGKILLNLDQQMRLVEDTFGLINDEIRARSPEQLLADIEEVVIASNTMTVTMEEVAMLDAGSHFR